MHTYLSNNKSYFEEILAGLKISFEAQTEKYSSVLQASEKVVFSANKIQGVVKKKFSHPPLSLKPLQKELTELKSSMVILSLPAELKTLENILTSANETLEEKLVSEVEKQIFTLYSQLNEATNKIDLQLANIKKVKKSIQEIKSKLVAQKTLSSDNSTSQTEPKESAISKLLSKIRANDLLQQRSSDQSSNAMLEDVSPLVDASTNKSSLEKTEKPFLSDQEIELLQVEEFDPHCDQWIENFHLQFENDMFDANAFFLLEENDRTIPTRLKSIYLKEKSKMGIHIATTCFLLFKNKSGEIFVRESWDHAHPKYCFEPNQVFIISFLVANYSKTIWPQKSYLASLDQSSLMTCSAKLPLKTISALPERCTWISVKLSTPEHPGVYVKDWELQNKSNWSFGNRLQLIVNVGEKASRPFLKEIVEQQEVCFFTKEQKAQLPLGNYQGIEQEEIFLYQLPPGSMLDFSPFLNFFEKSKAVTEIFKSKNTARAGKKKTALFYGESFGEFFFPYVDKTTKEIYFKRVTQEVKANEYQLKPKQQFVFVYKVKNEGGRKWCSKTIFCLKEMKDSHLSQSPEQLILNKSNLLNHGEEGYLAILCQAPEEPGIYTEFRQLVEHLPDGQQIECGVRARLRIKVTQS